MEVIKLKDTYIRIRVTTEEKEILKKHYEEKGYTKLSNYLRHLIEKDMKNFSRSTK